MECWLCQCGCVAFAQSRMNEGLRMKRFLGLPWAMVVVVAALLALFGVTRLFGDSTSSAVAAAPAAQQIGMKVLLITDSANSNAGIADCDWVNTLQREGVPYTLVVTNASPRGACRCRLSHRR